MLIAGMSRRDITPPQGLELAGYPHYPRYNTGAHDPLLAICMYLECGGEAVATVALDLLFFSKKHVAEARRRAEAKTGIPAKNIMISCTHTHSGPWTAGRDEVDALEAGAEQPWEYVEFVISQIAEAIKEAKENSFEASFTSGVSMCGAESGVGGNRRIKGGPCDPLVSVIAVKDKSDKVRGVIANYALHPTFIHEWSTVCTADFPCYVRTQIEELYPTAIAGFTQGTSGNQSSRYYRQGESYDEAERIGRIMGRAAASVLNTGKWCDDITIKVATDEIENEIRVFGTEEELAKRAAEDKANYEELYAKYGQSEDREEYYLWQNANLKYLGSEEQYGYVKLLKSGVKFELIEDENPSEIQIIRLGDICLIGLPGEIFVEYGLYLKAMAGFRTVIVNELTNGCLPGYLYTPESLVTGGYETGNSLIGENFGINLVNKTIETIKLVK